MQLREKESTDTKVTNGRSTSKDLHAKTEIRHSRLGVWDFYEEIELFRPRIALAPLLAKYEELADCFPYLVRMVEDVFNIPGCPRLVVAFAGVQCVQAVLPALSIWLQGQLLQITQRAIDTRTVDKGLLFRVAVGQLAISLASSALHRLRWRAELPLNARIRRWWALHSMHAHVRVDLPTFEQSSVRRKLSDTDDSVWGQTVVWQTLELLTDLFTVFTQFVAQIAVLFQVLKGQQDGPLLALFTLVSEAIQFMAQRDTLKPVRVWLSTTTDKDYVKMQGWKRAVRQNEHRKEFVAGNMAEHATSEFTKAAERIGDRDGDWHEWSEHVLYPKASLWTYLQKPLTHLPQIIFIFRAARHPSAIPLSIASLHLVQNAASKFVSVLWEIAYRTRHIEENFTAVRKVYEVTNIPNVIQDGTVPFPEDKSQIRYGIAIEFRNVSFKYPGAKSYALRHVSFSLSPGQLCVIVGSNGSGKSTILKLISRLYDPEEGEIFVGGHDIRTLKLRDLREAISVLFQDYTIFPLSIRDNIAMGDPASCDDDERVRLAARLAGVESFVDKLPNGIDTYLHKPVSDEYSDASEGTTTLTGRLIDYAELRKTAKVNADSDSTSTSLSGGQLQRIAVARTYMRSVIPEETHVGLLLFDEPSAALDPIAENDLFERLRDLRGSKTMIFSSHRFGNLTRHADLIIYMNDAVTVESGTHDELMKKEGEYAKLWNLQAKAFIN